jgi:putative transposase
LWRLRTRIRCQREDLRNKFCAIILSNYQHIGIETLDTKKMGSSVKKRENKHKLNMHLRDVSLYEIRHRLQTLGELLGRHVVAAPSNYPSTRRCSRCNHMEPPLPINQRTFVCSKCGLTIDRDLNAAINLKKLTGRGTSSSTPESVSSVRSELIKSNIKHSLIEDGQEVGTRS